MITVVKTPRSGAVFLTENPIIIEVASTLDPAHFFKVFLKVNGQDFDVQGWSKYNDTNCIINLKKMFSSVFEYTFSPVTTTGLVHVESLLKEIEVTVKEYRRIDEVEVNSITLPSFYVLKSEKEIAFNHTINLQKLSAIPETYRVSANAVVNIPVWITKNVAAIQVENNQNVLFSQSYSNLSKGIYQLQLNLSDFNFITNEIILTLFSVDDVFVQKINIGTPYLHQVSKLYFKNNYGVYEYAELFGTLATSNAYSRKTYTLQNEIEYIANTTSSKKHKLNTDFMFPEELPVIDMINSSSDVKFLIDGNYINCIPISKKSKGIDTEEPYQSDVVELQENFTQNHNDSINYD